jgi:pimeloyl-ACP methyl ester carboxylesterase
MLSRCSRSLASPTLYRRCTPTRPLLTSGSATPEDEPQQDSRTLKLPDSRLLGYAQYGDSNGNPLFFFHGLPSSRLECAELDPIAKKHNIHLIGIDRPGMGLSTFQPNRKILDWPDDVTRLADHLELNSFRVVGSSGGGPYALACAYTLPQDRLHGVGIIAGVGPWQAGTKGMLLVGRIMWNLWAWAPWTFKAIYEKSWVKVAQDPDPDKLNQMCDKAMETMREKDRRLFENETIRKCTVEALRAALVQGVDGVAHEAKLLTTSWGFKVEDVKYKAVKLWYGDEDTNTPLWSGRYMAQRLPGSKLKVYPGETHYMTASYERGEEILKEMMDVD